MKPSEHWAEFSVGRLAELCRLQQYCDSYADRMTKRLLQRAIFSVYLDCRQAGLSAQAREILTEWVPTDQPVTSLAAAEA